MTGLTKLLIRTIGLTVFLISYLFFMGLWHPGYVYSPLTAVDMMLMSIGIIYIIGISAIIVIGVNKIT